MIDPRAVCPYDERFRIEGGALSAIRPGVTFRLPHQERHIMGFFSKILDKLGIGSAKAETPSTPSATGSASPGTATASPSVTAMPMVDVVAKLEQRASSNAEKLNWRTSIVDLLKLLDIDSSLDERKALAKELGAPASVMDHSSEMNMWLHKEVLGRIAANGGNVPANLLD